MTVLIRNRGSYLDKEVSASDLEIGSVVKIGLYGDADTDGDGYTEFIVVHQGNPNPSVYDSSCDGTWLWCKTPFVTMAFDDDTKTNDYENSDVHAWLNDEDNFAFKSSAHMLAIKQVKIPYYYGVDDSETSSCNATLRNGSKGLLCELGFFLLSRTEIAGEGYADNYAPCGAPLDYFKYGSEYNNLRRNYYHQWLRTPYGKSETLYYMHYVSPMGSLPAGEGEIDDITDGYAVCPACIISSTAKFDRETGILISA